jgi:hypothetical protein
MRCRLLFVFLVALLASCGGGADPQPTVAASDPGTAVVGEGLFNQRVVGSNPGCVTCHSLDEGVVLVGPSLAGIADRAGSTVPGVSAADYLRQSITEPDAFVVDGFVEGQMPGGWDESLSPLQIDSLVDFLLER